jgi:hypothetical protein
MNQPIYIIWLRGELDIIYEDIVIDLVMTIIILYIAFFIRQNSSFIRQDSIFQTSFNWSSTRQSSISSFTRNFCTNGLIAVSTGIHTTRIFTRQSSKYFFITQISFIWYTTKSSRQCSRSYTTRKSSRSFFIRKWNVLTRGNIAYSIRFDILTRKSSITQTTFTWYTRQSYRKPSRSYDSYKWKVHTLGVKAVSIRIVIEFSSSRTHKPNNTKKAMLRTFEVAI